jgi:uncharacterized protein
MLLANLRVLYLHGFASSPASHKACFFKERLASFAIALEILDLCEGNFERLTITGQLKVIERAIDMSRRSGERLVLIGSSLGGYLAALYAARHCEVDSLILLAPAFQFSDLWANELGPERLALWKENDSMPVFHYAQGREVPIGYQLLEDARSYEPFPAFGQPALIFHGTQDPVVPVQYSLSFAQKHRNVRLVQLESGHELTDVLEKIWQDVKNFLCGHQDHANVRSLNAKC